jgi:hypothetical protein
MTTQNVETQNIHLKISTYPLAYSDAKNVFIAPSVVTNGKNFVHPKIEDIKI